MTSLMQGELEPILKKYKLEGSYRCSDDNDAQVFDVERLSGFVLNGTRVKKMLTRA